jgi:C4-dicarboxylate-specific signal transduction histidine kinase
MHQPGVSEFVLTVYDISERVQAEQAYDQENYLARYNAMGDMAMAIAHELGQPLAAANNFLAGVRARARTLEGCAETAGATEMLAFGLDGAERQIERAATIVSSVRSYVGHLEQVSGRVDLNDVVEECLYFVGLRADPAGIEVELDLSSDPVHVRCERVLTGQVVLNLCFNAVDELSQCEPDNRVLRISTSTATYDGKTSGMVTVEDRGRGLTQDPFAESFTSKERGSGIGLALSYRIITRQHGMIWAESREGGGTRFAFTLPRE